MTKRPLSTNPETVRRREQRMFADIDRQYREWHVEIGAYMEAHDVDYDTAFVACGGTIIPFAPAKRTNG